MLLINFDTKPVFRGLSIPMDSTVPLCLYVKRQKENLSPVLNWSYCEPLMNSSLHLMVDGEGGGKQIRSWKWELIHVQGSGIKHSCVCRICPKISAAFQLPLKRPSSSWSQVLLRTPLIILPPDYVYHSKLLSPCQHIGCEIFWSV